MHLLWNVYFCLIIAQCDPTLFGKPETRPLTKFECDVFYSATFHMYFTKNILYLKNAKLIGFKPDFSFEPEIVKTVNIMFNNNMEMEPVWMVYIYMHKVDNFLNATVKTDSNREDTLSMYKWAESSLAADIVKLACNKDNIFNKQSENCTHFKRFMDKKDAAGSKYNQLIAETVKSNKDLVNNSVIDSTEYLQAERLVNTGHVTFTGIEVLYFKNEKGHGSYLEKMSKGYLSPAYWGRVLGAMEQIRQGTLLDGLKGIKYLGLYQITVVQSLRAIMLGLAWSYFKVLPEGCTINEFSDVLNGFVLNTALEDDAHFTEFVKLVETGPNECVIEKIKSTLSSNSMFKYISSTELETDKSHTELLKMAKTFLVSLKERFGSRTVFNHCAAFSRMVNNRVGSKVKINYHFPGYM